MPKVYCGRKGDSAGLIRALTPLAFASPPPANDAKQLAGNMIKVGSRKKKLALIEASNPAWRDLYDDLV